jgi:SAM-dependent methyltransferase
VTLASPARGILREFTQVHGGIQQGTHNLCAEFAHGKNRSMKRNKDAYGQLIEAYLEGKPSYEIVERDDGSIGPSGGAPTYFVEYKNWPEWQKRAIKFAAGRVLDVGAGAGRVSLYLQRRGCKVTAIDNSPLAIQVCRRRGVKDARVISIGEVGKFSANTFDTVVMYGNNFGLFGSRAGARRLLKILYARTTLNAVIIAESNDPYKTSDPSHLAYQKRNRKRGRMSGQLRIRIRFRESIGNWFDYLIVSKKEVQEILKGTGWKARQFFNSGKSTYTAVIAKEK